MYRLCDHSLDNLDGVMPELVAITTLALKLASERGAPEFVVTEGLHTQAEHHRLVDEGKRQTLDSLHIAGRAIDIAVFDEEYHFTWNAAPFREVADCFKDAARLLQIPLEWGGDWQNFVDMPHFQIPRSHQREVWDTVIADP